MPRITIDSVVRFHDNETDRDVQVFFKGEGNTSAEAFENACASWVEGVCRPVDYAFGIEK